MFSFRVETAPRETHCGRAAALGGTPRGGAETKRDGEARDAPAVASVL